MSGELGIEQVKLRILQQFKDKSDICLLMLGWRDGKPPVRERLFTCSDYYMNIEVTANEDFDCYQINFIEYNANNYTREGLLDISSNMQLTKDKHIVESIELSDIEIELSLKSCHLVHDDYVFRNVYDGVILNDLCYFNSITKTLEYNKPDGYSNFVSGVQLSTLLSKASYLFYDAASFDSNQLKHLKWDAKTSKETVQAFKKIFTHALNNPTDYGSPVMTIINAIDGWIKYQLPKNV